MLSPHLRNVISQYFEMCECVIVKRVNVIQQQQMQVGFFHYKGTQTKMGMMLVNCQYSPYASLK